MAPVKKFSKPGQKYATPDKNDSLYKFYTSLMKQKPKSEMAKKLCLEHCVFGPKKADKVLLEMQLSKLKI